MAKRKQAQKKEPVLADEKARLRALKVVGHDFAIGKDKHGRDRVIHTATAGRDYDIGNMKSVVRVRNVDPLQGMSALTWQQRQAGKNYREDYEICAREGVKTGSWDIRVDGGGANRDLPERISDAHANLQSAHEALGYGEIRRTVTSIVGDGMSVKALAEQDRNPRIVIAKLLSMGLEKLAVHYGIVSAAKRVDR